jgi:hypothetical protein
MYMLFQALKQIFFSKEAGGGDNGAATGIVQNIMITGGHIIVIIPPGIEKFLMIGGIITAPISGVVVLGILRTSITAISIITGVAVIGVMTMDWAVLAAFEMGVPWRTIVETDVPSRRVVGMGAPSRTIGEMGAPRRTIIERGALRRMAVGMGAPTPMGGWIEVMVTVLVVVIVDKGREDPSIHQFRVAV